MLFRYKITMCNGDSFDRIFHGYARRYNVEIQYLKQDAKVFKWRPFDFERLCCILRSLGHNEDEMYSVQDFEDVLKQYKDINEIVTKYIQKEIEVKNMADKQNKHADEIDNLVITNGWCTIEVKENE